MEQGNSNKGIAFMLVFMAVIVAICVVGFLFPQKKGNTEPKKPTCEEAWKDSTIYYGMSMDSVIEVVGEPYMVLKTENAVRAYWCDTLQKSKTEETDAFVLYFEEGKLNLIEKSKILL